MSKEYTIGRAAVSAIKVPADKSGVSGIHAKITIDDNGLWAIEDLHSTNGTFVQDAEGEFHQVFNKQITESDVIRLGNGGVNSYIFTAKRVELPADDYAYEFRQLRKKLKLQKEEEAQLEKRRDLNGWLTSCTGALIYGLTFVISGVFKVDIQPGTRYALMAGAPILVKACFSGDAKKLKHLKKKREKVLICPKCGKPIPEYDIENGQCAKCKAI